MYKIQINSEDAQLHGATFVAESAWKLGELIANLLPTFDNDMLVNVKVEADDD